jgi:hypothetical protein
MSLFSALIAARFKPLFALSDEELAARGASSIYVRVFVSR